jgi:hypothetical protein
MKENAWKEEFIKFRYDLTDRSKNLINIHDKVLLVQVEGRGESSQGASSLATL